jgi:hypothetical protein
MAYWQCPAIHACVDSRTGVLCHRYSVMLPHGTFGWYSDANDIVVPAWTAPDTGERHPGFLVSDYEVVAGWMLPPTLSGGRLVVLPGWYDESSSTMYPGIWRQDNASGGVVWSRGYYCPHRCEVVPFRHYAVAPGPFTPAVRRALVARNGAGVRKLQQLEHETGCCLSFKPLGDGPMPRRYRCVVTADSWEAARWGAQRVAEAAAAVAATASSPSAAAVAAAPAAASDAVVNEAIQAKTPSALAAATAAAAVAAAAAAAVSAAAAAVAAAPRASASTDNRASGSHSTAGAGSHSTGGGSSSTGAAPFNNAPAAKAAASDAASGVEQDGQLKGTASAS